LHKLSKGLDLKWQEIHLYLSSDNGGLMRVS